MIIVLTDPRNLYSNLVVVTGPLCAPPYRLISSAVFFINCNTYTNDVIVVPDVNMLVATIVVITFEIIMVIVSFLNAISVKICFMSFVL